MSITPEIKDKSIHTEEAITTKEVSEVPFQVEHKEDDSALQSAPKANTSYMQRQPLSNQTARSTTYTINAPADDTQLQTWSQGDPGQSLTWLGKYWIRIIAKARRLGWLVANKDENA